MVKRGAKNGSAKNSEQVSNLLNGKFLDEWSLRFRTVDELLSRMHPGGRLVAVTPLEL